jgi:hypothetical protein
MKYWSGLMIATGIALSFVLTCITPFAAVAAFAAQTVPRRLALVTLLGTLAGNQIVGYAFLGYPHTPQTYLWGPLLAIASLAAFEAARPMRNLFFAFVAAFVAYEAFILVFSAATNTLADFTLRPFVQALEANLTGFVLLAFLRAGFLAVDRYVRGRVRHAHR